MISKYSWIGFDFTLLLLGLRVNLNLTFRLVGSLLLVPMLLLLGLFLEATNQFLLIIFGIGVYTLDMYLVLIFHYMGSPLRKLRTHL